MNSTTSPSNIPARVLTATLVSTKELEKQLSAAERANWHAKVLLARAASPLARKADTLSKRQTSEYQNILDKTDAEIPALRTLIAEASRESEAIHAALAFANRPLSKYVVGRVVDGGHTLPVLDKGIRYSVLLHFFAEATYYNHQIREGYEWVVPFPGGERFTVEACK